MDTRISAELKDICHRFSANVEENKTIFIDEFNPVQAVVTLQVLWCEN